MQQLIVSLIVLCAGFNVAKRYLPAALRAKLRMRGAMLAGGIGWVSLANRLATQKTAAASSCSDGCGSCNGCGTVTAKPAAGAGLAVQQTINIDGLRRNSGQTR